MDPLSIAASVGALTATCLSTCKKLSDIAGNYQDAPAVITMICSESSIISIALSELQKNILQRQDLSQAWASRTDVLVAFETARMMVFSCLEAETRQLQSQTPNLSGMRVWTKLKFLWNQDRLKELLSALRGQQSSIKFLIQVLEINTLSDIQRNIRDNVSKIQKPASEARSLRSNNPSVKMEAQSIFDNENTRLSLFDVGAISAVAPSELDFDFDDLVLNSQAYRRAFAQAQSDADLETQARGTEDIGLHLSGDATIRRINQDLVDLNLVTIVEPSSPRSVSTILERQESAPGDTDNPSLQQEEESTTLRDRTDVIAQELPNASELTTSSEHTCRKCSRGIIGQFVRKRGQTFHPDCFTCIDCGEIIETRFSPLEDESYSQICEKDYYRRLGLLCHDCGQSLVGSYLTSGDKKYHLEHFKREISTVAIHTMDVAHAELLKAKEDEIRVFINRLIGYREVMNSYQKLMKSGMMGPKRSARRSSKRHGLQQNTGLFQQISKRFAK